MEHFNPNSVTTPSDEDAELRVMNATDALDAVYELCNEHGHMTLAHVGSENMACLLKLIVKELRAGQL